MRKSKAAKVLAAAAAVASTLFLSVPNPAMSSLNAPITLYGAPLERLEDEEGVEAITTDSPFTDLTYTHEDKFEGYELFHGIDVSKWNNLASPNQTIDWAACKEAGVDYAFVRVGYRKLDTGELMEDPYYKENIKGALKNGISVGVYVYSGAITTKEAKEEAKFLIKRVKKYNVTLPLVIDYEGGYYTSNGKDKPGRVVKAYQDGKLTKTSATKVIKAFCKYVEDAGYTPMIYANCNYLLNYMNGAQLGKKYPVWMARYAQSPDPQNGFLYYDGNYDYWQYSEKGYIGSMQVDCNFLYKDFNILTDKPYTIDQTVSSITLEWEPVSDEQGYYIYRLNPETGKYKKIGKTTECEYVDGDVEPATEYSYKVRAYWTIGTKTCTAKNSKATVATTATKRVTKLVFSSNKEGSVTLGWKAVAKAKGYVVYQYDKTEDEYLEVATVVGKKNTTCEIEGLSPAKQYQFIVCAYLNFDGERILSEDSDVVYTVTKPAKVKSIEAYAVDSDAVTIRFAKQSRVSGYKVYRYNEEAGKWKLIGTSTDGFFEDTGVEAGKTYQYRVRAYKDFNGSTYYGAYSGKLSVKTVPAAPENVAVAARNKKSVALTWEGDEAAEGYIVYRFNPESGEYEELAVIEDNQETSYKDTGLEKATSYEYAVCAYITFQDEQLVSEFSEPLVVKTKK